MRPDRARADGESFQHVAVPYDSDASLLGLVAPRVRAALGEGRHVLVITSRLPQLAEALGPDADRVETRPPASWYAHPFRMLAACHDYTRGRRTLVVGEPVWQGRSAREIGELIRCESVLNAALRPATATLLCLYDVRATPRDVADSCPVNHPVLLGPDGEVPSARYVEPYELVLPHDRAPLPPPPADAVTIGFAGPGLRRARQAVAAYARVLGMDADRVTSLVISVSEIAANSIEHGAGHGVITLWRAGGELVCEITEPGGALDDPLPGCIPPEPASLRGYGLWISRQLCDLVELRSGGGALRVRLRLSLGP
ncbi:sensor histidine kinase [Nonomuraea aridisoli]|uniref:sensor histidine kinase n=1 Tax=Nonomuraea aridisoli TaxID=2070368 RepID=UPI0011B93FF8|nr:sensor histidine kinase [Nonomuraea aridisoli]